jgi:TonB family protein
MKILKLISMCLIGATAGCRAARPVTWPAPRYPDLLRTAGVQGRSIAHIMVSADGVLDSVRLDRGPGFHELFERSVRDAFRDMKFIPARRGGKAVNGEIIVPVAFILLRPKVPRPAGAPASFVDSMPEHCPAPPAATELVVCTAYEYEPIRY